MRSPFDTAVRIAERQHGRVARWQLLAAGIDRGRIQRWCADGRLRRVHLGVYAVGHEAPSLLADVMAAVLACGPGAAISHRSATHLLSMIRGRPPAQPEVTVPTAAGRRRPGITIHRVRALPRADVIIWQRIPVTSPARTLLDLAPSLAEPELARAAHEAWVHHRTSPEHVATCASRNPGKPGAAKLHRALHADVTVSALERGFVELLQLHRLPLPRTNRDRRGDKVDCHWPDRDLTIELVSYRYHATRHAFEIDVARRRRSSHLAFSYGDVFQRGDATAREVRAALLRASARS